MTKFKPTDKVKYDGEVLTIKVSRKNFANKKIFYRFEGKGNMEVEEKDLKKVSLTAKEKKVEKEKKAKDKLLKLGQERVKILTPYKDTLSEMDDAIDLDNISEENLISLAKFSKASFGEMVESLLEEEAKLDQRDKELNEDIDETDKPLDESKTKMSRKSKKDKK